MSGTPQKPRRRQIIGSEMRLVRRMQDADDPERHIRFVDQMNAYADRVEANTGRFVRRYERDDP